MESHEKITIYTGIKLPKNHNKSIHFPLLCPIICKYNDFDFVNILNSYDVIICTSDISINLVKNYLNFIKEKSFLVIGNTKLSSDFYNFKDAENLCNFLLKNKKFTDKKILYLRGFDITFDLIKEFDLDELIVYRTYFNQLIYQKFIDVILNFKSSIFFISKRGVDSFFIMIKNIPTTVELSPNFKSEKIKNYFYQQFDNYEFKNNIICLA